MKKDIIQKLKTFPQKTILVIGDVMVDAYIWGKVNRISPEAPVPVLSISHRENRLGGAANVGLNLLSLSAKPIICSVIGEDEKGKIFLELLKKQNLTTDGIITSELRKTTSKTRVISSGQHLLRVDEEITNPLNAEIEKNFISHIIAILKHNSIDAIIFEDYDKGCISPNLINEIVSFANNKNIPVTVDPKKTNFLEYKNISIFKPNLLELREGMKMDLPKSNPQEINNAANLLLTEKNHSNIIVTLSEYGIYVTDGNKWEIFPAEKRDIVDVSGAGDTVIAVATLCIAAGIGIFETARIANIAGGLVCEKVGVVPIERNELFDEFDRS
ncbi:MAG: hypothetical protein JXR58_10850 [Bacteroidales bacterium]|nr:hypothetical protein [Bacteroidales bacterium]